MALEVKVLRANEKALGTTIFHDVFLKGFEFYVYKLEDEVPVKEGIALTDGIRSDSEETVKRLATMLPAEGRYITNVPGLEEKIGTNYGG